MISHTQIAELIRAALPEAKVQVEDPNHDGQHFSAIVVADQFEGLSMIKQHKLIYGAIQEHLDTGEIHALQLKTYSLSQWQKIQVQVL
ncbi:MAG: BolA family transcriptional regulator [Oscillatoriales cyanobacterium CG2_30_44_21]|nr:MAG: BolA family transcriptional regulator [Oscillatoriales cyanobacterium CG2_30_44_21]